MPNSIDLTIEKWCAWAPGVESGQQWLEWANDERDILDEGTPNVTFVAPMLRRRLSLLSRMALYVANGCLDENQPMATVFCTRHGELHRTVELLQSIVNKELVSPMGFSHSVPNTAAGIHSIFRKDTSVSTTMSAGTDSFEQSLIEAAMLVNSVPEKQVLLICCDMPLPQVFSKYEHPNPCYYAFALLLGHSEKQAKFNLSFSCKDGALIKYKSHPLNFLRYLLTKQRQLTVQTSRLTWNYLRHAS